MCEPVTIATLAVMAVGAVVSAYAAHQQGEAQSAAAKYQSKVAKNNAILAERSAQDAERRGQIAASQQAAYGRRVMGAQRAGFAANGIDLGSDSVGDIQASQAGLNELDNLTVRANAQREAAGFRQQGMNYQAESDLQSNAAKNYSYQGNMAAASSLISGSAQVGQSWYSMSGPATQPSAGWHDNTSVKWGTSSSVWNRGY